MKLVRGRAATRAADRAATAAMLDRTAENRQPALRVWTPHQQVTFGRRDANEDGYEAARAAARKRGFTPTERSVGGRAVAYTGTTLAFAHARPIDDLRQGLGDRYDDATTTVQQALAGLGVDATAGEPPEAFCPGSYSLQADGKLVGIAQRVRSGAALVSGIVIVDDCTAIGDVLDPVYDTLGVPFDPHSVGSVASAGGPAEPGAVARALENAFVGDETRTVLSVGEFVDVED
ncbi:lipoate--protein ligase family protein [Natranaeroarchaeum aerophilus]|uniref:Lipoate--protein ligase family protein n=1 Tax=Natranaeroarchaeum aerophilus TaxID=2917711 RepID=A0AAE3FSG3_9EURY|nr:lipoate--protein ligase family protein [Natranaeroarchaeum aerophilus]MCL9814742.1 lipoate--protein ligase family protein [Natranaeroarchaeum aerophilus]